MAARVAPSRETQAAPANRRRPPPSLAAARKQPQAETAKPQRDGTGKPHEAAAHTSPHQPSSDGELGAEWHAVTRLFSTSVGRMPTHDGLEARDDIVGVHQGAPPARANRWLVCCAACSTLARTLDSGRRARRWRLVCATLRPLCAHSVPTWCHALQLPTVVLLLPRLRAGCRSYFCPVWPPSWPPLLVLFPFAGL